MNYYALKLFKLRICLVQEVRGLAIKGAGVANEARQKLIEWFCRVDVTVLFCFDNVERQPVVNSWGLPQTSHAELVCQEIDCFYLSSTLRIFRCPFVGIFHCLFLLRN